MPMPSARAASHRVWTAATAEYSLVSGIVWRPRPWPRAVSRSAKTARWQGASSSPASFSRAYCAARSGSCPASASALQVSKFRRTAARRSGSSTRINRQGWLSPTDGARQASSSTFSIEPCGSGSGRNRRTSRRQISNSRNVARKAASNAGTGGIAISVHQLPQYGTGRSAAPRLRQRREAAFVGEARSHRPAARICGPAGGTDQSWGAERLARAVTGSVTMRSNILDPQADDVASSELAIDG